MGIIPIVAIVGGRVWPYLICLPITALPIAGKTLRYLAYRTNDVSLITGWVIYFFIPLIFITWFSLKLIRNQNNHSNGMSFIRYTLCINTVFYFFMNWSFFNWPWPWTTWTMRTPSGIIFLFCTISLLFLINYYQNLFFIKKSKCWSKTPVEIRSKCPVKKFPDPSNVRN